MKPFASNIHIFNKYNLSARGSPGVCLVSLGLPAASLPRSTASNTSSGTGANRVHVTAALCALNIINSGVSLYNV